MVNVGLVCNSDLADAFYGRNDCNVAYSVNSGSQAFEMQVKTNADVVVTDLVVPMLDGFELINELNSLENKPRIVVHSELKGETFINRAYDLGAERYFVKPADKQQLVKIVLDKQRSDNTLSQSNAVGQQRALQRKVMNHTLDERISNIFITVGIPAHIKGYQYLREGIKLAVENPSVINSITKNLYPTVAEIFDTTSSKVERAIRHAIEVAWGRGRIENINALFGIKVYNTKDKPTNGEFIALLADKMLLEYAN